MAAANRDSLSSQGVAPSQRATLIRSGEVWTVGLGERTFPLRDLKGLNYIQRLLRHPHEEFHSLDLLAEPGAAADGGGAASDVRGLLDNPAVHIGGIGDAGELLDAKAKADYQRRLAELGEHLEDLEERGDRDGADRAREEIDFLRRELVRAVGLGGRARRAGSAAERARLNVTRAIKNAIEKVGEHDRPLAELLGRAIRTGSFCSYAPDPRAPVVWSFSVETSASSDDARATAPVIFSRGSNFVHAFAGGTAFVGRAAERAALDRALADARGGHGRIVMLSGPAGVGKTRTAAEVGARASREGALTLVGRCYDRDDSVPFIPFVEILEAALGQASSPAAFRAALGKDAPEISRLLPQIRRLFPDIPAPLELPPEQSRRLLFNAVSSLLAETAAQAPVVLLLDDLHWADQGTLLLLVHLAQLIAQLPVLMVGTYRDFELTPGKPLAAALDELTRLHLVDQITLGGLDKSAVGELLAALSGREPPPAVVDVIYAGTEGNPFFVEELFHHLVEQGRLLAPDGSFRSDLKLNDIDAPQSVRLVIGRRLARLAEPTRQVFGGAAVIGRSFTLGLLEGATGRGAEALLDCVEEAERAGLITSTIEYPDAKFSFAHELIRQTVLQSLSAARRQRLHLDVANAMERLYADALEDHAEDLAHHLWQAGTLAEPARTIKFLQMAADQAIQRSATVEAVGNLRNALKLIKSLPDNLDRSQLELQLLTTLGTALVATKGFSSLEVEGVYNRARELSQRVGQSPQFFRILWGQWINHQSRSEYEIALQLGEQCLELAQSAGDRVLIVEAHHALGISRGLAGDLRRSMEHFDQAIASYDREQRTAHLYGYGQDPAAICHIHAGWAMWLLGYPEQALRHNDEGLALARETTHPGNLANAAAFGGLPLQLCRNGPAVQVLAESAVKISTEHNLPYTCAMGTILEGWALTQNGRIADGIVRMEQGLAILRSTDAVLMVPYFSSLLAQAYGAGGRAADGLQLLASVNSSHDRWWEAELHRIRGELILNQAAAKPTQQLEAENSFSQALAIARSHNAKSLELRAAFSLARLWLQQQRQTEARNLMSETYEWFTEGLNTPDLREAKAMLDALRSAS